MKHQTAGEQDPQSTGKLSLVGGFGGPVSPCCAWAAMDGCFGKCVVAEMV